MICISVPNRQLFLYWKSKELAKQFLPGSGASNLDRTAPIVENPVLTLENTAPMLRHYEKVYRSLNQHNKIIVCFFKQIAQSRNN